MEHDRSLEGRFGGGDSVGDGAVADGICLSWTASGNRLKAGPDCAKFDRFIEDRFSGGDCVRHDAAADGFCQSWTGSVN